MRRLVIALAFIASTAHAHPHISSGPAFANISGQLVTFGISHGCSGKDTAKIHIDIPLPNITGVRALYSSFGAPTAVTKDASNNVTSVEWEKATYLTGDNTYPEFTLRLKVGDVPFTTIPFVVTQTCRDASGDTVVVWDQLTSTGNTAPPLTVVPARLPGWNKLTLTTPIAMADLPKFFGDAQIVWRGTSAYSPNAVVAAMIAMTPGVSALATDLAANDEIWVKY